MEIFTLVLGGALTLTGAALLVTGFRHGQAGRIDDERRTFRFAVGGLAVGSLMFLATVMLSQG